MPVAALAVGDHGRVEQIMMAGLGQDLGFGIRVLRRSPEFTVMALICVGLGVGPTTAMFSLLNAFLFRPLPFPGADRLVQISRETEDLEGAATFTLSEVQDLAGAAQTFEYLVARTFLPLNLRHEETEKVQAELVGADYLRMLEVSMEAGRSFAPGEALRVGGEALAVISHRLWQRSFAGEPDVLGKSVRLNGHLFTIIGVAAEDFKGMTPMVGADVWIPVTMQIPLALAADDPAGRNHRWLALVGLLRPGVSEREAAAELSTLYREEPASGAVDREGRLRLQVDAFQGIGVPARARGRALQATTAALVLVAFSLIIAFSNFANLQLARSQSRIGEMGVRLALGAGRYRLLRQLLLESLLLSLAGGILGFALAHLLVRFFHLALPRAADHLDYTIDLDPDPAVLLVTLALTFVAGILFGLTPALNATRADIVAAILGAGRGEALGRARGGFSRGALIAGQMALCCVLLVVTGLLIRTLGRSISLEPGFEPRGVLAAHLTLDGDRYGMEEGRAFQRRLVQEAAALPGVARATLADRLPFDHRLRRAVVGKPAAAARDAGKVRAGVVRIGSGHFDVLGAPLVAGRDFNSTDSVTALPVAIIDQALARLFWPDETPVDQNLQIGEGSESIEVRIIGVIRDVRYSFSLEDAVPMVYRPLAQDHSSRATLLLRSSGAPSLLANPIRSLVRELDPDLAISDVLTLEEHVDAALAGQRSIAILFGAVAGLGLLLALLGLYGVMSYHVERRRREVGIRLALGAQRMDIVVMMLIRGARVALAGLVLGLGLSVLAGQILWRLLHGLDPADPITFGVVTLGLGGAIFLACLIPARRASRQVPMASLRTE